MWLLWRNVFCGVSIWMITKHGWPYIHAYIHGWSTYDGRIWWNFFFRIKNFKLVSMDFLNNYHWSAINYFQQSVLLAEQTIDECSFMITFASMLWVYLERMITKTFKMKPTHEIPENNIPSHKGLHILLLRHPIMCGYKGDESSLTNTHEYHILGVDSAP